MAAWATQACTLADEGVEGARHVINDQGTDYSLVEMEEDLQLLTKQGQQLQELLAAGVAAGSAGHAQFEDVQKAVLKEVSAGGGGGELAGEVQGWRPSPSRGPGPWISRRQGHHLSCRFQWRGHC